MVKIYLNRFKILITAIFFVLTALLTAHFLSTDCVLSAFAATKSDISILCDVKIVNYDRYSVKYEIRGEHADLSGFTIEYLIDGSFTSKAPVDAGSYDVKITREEDENFNRYEKIINGGLVINKRKVTLTIDDVAPQTSGYFYDKTPKYTTATASGLLSGDEISYLLVYELNGSTEPVCAGEWKVKIESASIITDKKAENYELDFSDEGVMNISKRTVSLNWSELDATDLVFDGKEKVLSATADSVLEGDNVFVDVALRPGDDNVNVGSFCFVANGISDPNYALPENAVSDAYHITPKPIIFTVDDVVSGTEGYVYDGTEKKTTASYTDLALGDTLSYKLRYENGDSFNATNAGQWYVVIDSVTVTSGNENNYTFDITDSGTMVIDKKPITFEIKSIAAGTQGYVYDGTKKYVSATHTPLCGGDELAFELVYELDGRKDQISAGTWSVSVSNVEFVGCDGQNYQVDSSYVGTMVIDKRPATISWELPDGGEFVYSKSAKIVSATVSDLLEGDDCLVTTKLQDGCDNVNAGNFKYRAIALSNPNYVVAVNDLSPEIVILKKRLLVTAKDINVTYGAQSVAYELLYDGFCDGDSAEDIDVLPTVESRWTNTTSTLYSGMKISCYGGSDNNYDFDYCDGTLTINKLNINVFADDKSSIEGKQLSNLTFSTDIEPVFGDSFIGSLYTDASADTFGEYSIEQGSLYISENYNIIFHSAKYFVNAKTVISNGNVDAQLTTIDGVSPDTSFTLSLASQDEMPSELKQISGYNTINYYKLTVEGNSIDSNRWTVKLKIDGHNSVGNIRVAQIVDGKVEIKTVRAEGDYLVFNTTETGDFVVLEKQTGFTGVLLVIGVILFLMMLMYVFYAIKRKRDYNNYRF